MKCIYYEFWKFFIGKTTALGIMLNYEDVQFPRLFVPDEPEADYKRACSNTILHQTTRTNDKRQKE